MPVQRNFLLYVCSLSHADTEEARNVFELGLPGGTGNGPARPVSFYGRFVLFRPLPSEGVIGGMRWCCHLSRHGLAVALRSIGPHEQRVALGRCRGSAPDDGPARGLTGCVYRRRVRCQRPCGHSKGKPYLEENANDFRKREFAPARGELSSAHSHTFPSSIR